MLKASAVDQHQAGLLKFHLPSKMFEVMIGYSCVIVTERDHHGWRRYIDKTRSDRKINDLSRPDRASICAMLNP